MSKISIKNMDLHYGDFHALKNVNLEIEANKITAFIGPSGCGKSTLLKSINRMNDLVEGCRIDGQILLDGQDLFPSQGNTADLACRVYLTERGFAGAPTVGQLERTLQEREALSGDRS